MSLKKDLMYNNFGGFSIGSVSNASTNFNGTNFQFADDLNMIRGVINRLRRILGMDESEPESDAEFRRRIHL